MAGATARLCERLAALGFDDLGPAAVGHARTLVLDGLAVAAAGAALEAAPRLLAAHVREQGGTPVSSVVGAGFRTSPVQSAYVNGAAMHVLDYEPMWSPPNHQLSTCLPAVLALAEARGAGGRDVATALVIGIEVMGWLREASGQLEPSRLTLHPPGQVGPLGAAAAAGHLLGLEARELRVALGIAASRCGSLLANVGTMTKSTHCGLAAALGLDAALLAARGFTASPDVIEAPRGYAVAYFGAGFRADLLERAGPPFRVVEPGYALKMYPSQYATHYAIAAALELRERIGDPARIRRLRIVAPVMPYIDRPRPATGLDGKFSWQYTVACALLDGEVGMESFTDAARARPDLEALLGRVELDMRDEIPGRLEAMHVVLEAELEGGAAERAFCEGPPGSWRGPPVDPERHRAKVRDCLARALDDDSAARAIELAGRIDELDAAGVAELMEILRGGHG